MFTGIIEQLGKIKKVEKRSNMFCLIVESETVFEDIKSGESISVNGCCLTVTKIEGKNIYFDISLETAKKTNLVNLKINEMVNLERALRVTDRLSGHFVTGHIDGLGEIKNKIRQGDNISLKVLIPHELKNYIVAKGSIAVEGISLTINEISDDYFSLQIIPHTFKNTNLSYKRIGDKVNIEVDMLGKYARGNTPFKTANTISEEFLKEKGFI